MKTRLARILLAGIFLFSLLTSCNLPFGKTPTPTAAPTPTETLSPSMARVLGYLQQKLDLAPRVTSSTPSVGEEAGINADLTFSFNQAMDPATTAKAFAVTSADKTPVEGSISWKDTQTLVFHPQKALQAGSLYQASVADSAKSAAGKPLERPFKLSFQTAGELKVSQVMPGDQAADVAAKSTITVMFNRPVVPLKIAEEQGSLVNPLVLDPEVKGHGEWVNTSLYVFHPDGILKGGQTYQAAIKAGLADVSGDSATALAADYTWSFSVAVPGINDILVNDQSMIGGSMSVPLNPTLQIVFRQPMDTGSVEGGIHIRSGATDVALQTKWDEKNTTLTVKPSELLKLETTYDLTFDPSIRDAEGAALAPGFDTSFTTVPPPSVAYTTPQNGAQYADPYFQIYFASPMSFKSLQDKVVFSPELDVASHSWYNDGGNMWSFYGLEPSTAYTVRILPGMQDPYGNTIDRETDVSFTTQGLAPSAALVMPYRPVYRVGGPQDFYLQYVNVTSVNASLYPVSTEEAAALLSDDSKGVDSYAGGEDSRVWQYQKQPGGSSNKRVSEDLTMTGKDGKPLAPGFYVLGLTISPMPYDARFIDTRMLYVSTDNLTVKLSPGQILAWVTDLTTGQPTPNVRVTFYDNHFVKKGEAVTDAKGIAQAEVDTSNPYNTDQSYKDAYQSHWFAVVEGGGRFGFADSQWGSGASPDAFGLYGQYYRPWLDATSYVYTERPIYRPGQPVYFKGIVRSDDDLAYSLPTQPEVVVTISSYKGQVYQENMKLSGIGTFDGKFTLDEAAALGSYSLSVQFPGRESFLGSTTFDVADYKRPEFQMDVAAQPSNLLPGGSFTSDVSASYYSGGALSNAKVDWTLMSDPFNFTPPPAYSAYSFSNAEWDNWEYYASLQQGQATQQLGQGTGQTGSDGKASFSLKAEPIPSASEDRQLTFEATITDFSGSSVSGRAQVVMHKSQVYPGVRSKSYVGSAGDEQTFSLVLLDWDGKPQAGAQVDVDIVQREWYSVQEEDANGRLTWKSTVKETPVTGFSGVKLDDKGQAEVSFTPTAGGTYRAVVTAHDSHGNPAAASTFLWIAGKDFIPWAQTNDRTFQLVADRSSYTPGQTAELLIASPFQGETWALVALERGHVRKSEVMKLQGNSTVYRVPITPDMAPDVYVSVVVVKGVDDTNPRPNFKVGMARLDVTTDEQTLKVSLASSQPSATPGDKVDYTVQTATLDGKPVQAEVTLSLTDLATLSLEPRYEPALLDFFYAPRSLSVMTAVTLIQSIEDYNAEIAKHLAASGMGMGSGGGKGGGYMGVIGVRQNFPDTAFWEAQVQTGADGKATVTVTLPDNLTTWRMDARAVTADTRVGQTTMDIISTKPLLVRPQTPRFLVAGDQVTLGTAVHNNTDQDMEVAVSLDATGVDLSSPKEQKVQIAARQQAYVTWEASVPAGMDRVDLIFSASGGGYNDASRPTLGSLDGQGIPVYRYEAPETVGTSGVVSDNGGRLEAIDLPATMEVQKGRLDVQLAPSLAAGMTDGINYLEDYPYESIEATISSFLPNLRLGLALKAAGIQDAGQADALKTRVNEALQKLYNEQNPDGGWGWWNGMDSDLLTTAYVTLGMAEAKAAGYEVTATPLNNAIAYLDKNLSAVTNLTSKETLNRQAFVAYVLARAGDPAVGFTVNLYDQRADMALYARAFLMQTLHSIDPKDGRLKTMISDLASAAVLSASGASWEEKTADPVNWNTDVRTTAIVLGALIETDPGNALNANAVRWLMSSRTSGHWFATQETAWTLLALTDWVTASGELKPDYAYAVSFNNNELGHGTASPETVRDVQNLSVDVTDLLKDQSNKLVFARDGSAGNLYYTANLNLWLPVSQVQALDRGVVISREYFRPDDLTHPVTQASQGEVLLARLTVVAANTLHYLTVDDPLPAGMEAVNPALQTSPQAQPYDYDWTRIGSDGWGWWFFSHIEQRDEKIVLSTDTLPAGTYVYTYRVRASTPGTFNVIPPTAQEAYFPDVYGRGDGSRFVIEP